MSSLGLPSRADEEGHQRFADQPAVAVADVAIDDRDMRADTHDARVRMEDSSFDGFEIIDLHLDRSDAPAPRTSHIRRQPPGSVRERRDYATMHDAMNLLVPFADAHLQNDAARLGFVEQEAKLPGRVAGLETFAQFVGGKMFDGSARARTETGAGHLNTP
jgi:hypothetical protein